MGNIKKVIDELLSGLDLSEMKKQVNQQFQGLPEDKKAELKPLLDEVNSPVRNMSIEEILGKAERIKRHANNQKAN